MKPRFWFIPTLVTLISIGAACWYGPVAQLPHYHDFADQAAHFGVPHFFDVLSNLGFALLALWGWFRLFPHRHENSLRFAWAAYQLFLAGLFLTALGSSYYHLAPDNARLAWDRLPISLACAGLLAGVWSDVHARPSRYLALSLALLTVLGVAWWRLTDLAGHGDLRLYLALQVLPLILIPLWQSIYASPRADRWAFGVALLLYVAAKLAEQGDYEIAAALGGVSGHTLKHLLATAAAALIIFRLDARLALERASKSLVARLPNQDLNRSNELIDTRRSVLRA